MTFGQQPQGGNAQRNQFNNTAQPQYGQNQYDYQYGQAQYAPQGGNYAYSPVDGTAAINTQATYSYEEAERSSVSRAYAEMTIGLVVTAVVAVLTQMSGAYLALVRATGMIGAFAPLVVEIVLAVYLSARIDKMKVSTARIMFYVYAALMGFTLSTSSWRTTSVPSASPWPCVLDSSLH